MAPVCHQQIGGDIVSSSYSAPVRPDRQATLKDRTEGTTDRLRRFLSHPLDSIEVKDLADEIEGLAEHFRAVAVKSVDEHQDQTVRQYRVLVKSVSQYVTTIDCTDAEKWAIARDADGGEFEEIGEGTWQVESVDLAE